MKKQILIDNLEQLETREYTKMTPILVPENWEELKGLCKKLKLFVSKNINMEKDNEYIVCCWMNFYEYGDILDSDGYAISENRTPQQMWQIIKSLIGEE